MPPCVLPPVRWARRLGVEQVRGLHEGRIKNPFWDRLVFDKIKVR